jgi:YidC/Oxa1 family membrane protein insertase
MFDVLIVKPLFNLLVLIYALIPGHNFGLSIILFTVLIRFLMWPLIKKQLHHTKAMRELQPEIRRIKQATKGDRQKESMMIMELYKEREISPFGSIGILIVQLIILIGLYSGLRRVIDHPEAIIDFSYGWLQNLSWLKELGSDIGKFDATLFGVIDLTKAALPKEGGIYWPAMFLVLGSAISQYFQSVQLMPDDKDARGLRRILSDASSGKQADQAEVNAAVGRLTRYMIPVLILVFTLGIASALSLYWFVSGVVAYLQQARILGQDEAELEKVADASTSKKSKIIEGEVITKKKKPAPKKKKTSAGKKKRR